MKQSKKHAETLKRAVEANVSTRIGNGVEAKLEVQKPMNKSLQYFCHT